MSSLEALQTEVEGIRTEAQHLSEEFSREHAEVTNDPNLTAVGQREHLEPLHLAMTEQVAALHAREKAAVKTVKEKLERQVFGLSPAASSDPDRIKSYREAQALARDLEDSDAAESLYESAKRSSDAILAAAVLEKALVRGWSKIKDDYLQRNPTTRNDLDDLAALAKYSDNSLVNAVHYMVPRLNLPYSAGFTNIGGHTTSAPVRSVPSFADVMAQRVAQANTYGR